MNLKDIEDIKNVVIWKCICSGGSTAGRLPFSFDLSSLPFQPDFAVIRTINMNTTDPGGDTNVYVVTSDLTGGSIGSFQGNLAPIDPEITIAIKKPIEQAYFDVSVLNNTSNTLLSPVFIGNWYITISIDFIKMKKSLYKNNKIEY